MAFLGFKLQKLVLSLTFFMLGYYLSNILLGNIVDNNNLLVVINICIGLLLGSYTTKLYNFSAFMICFIITFLICLDIFDSNLLKYGLGLTLSTIIGYFGIKSSKIIIMIITSIYGSFNIISLIFNYFSYNNFLLYLIFSVILSLIAFNYQRKNNAN